MADSPKRGVYEELVTERLSRSLGLLAEGLHFRTRPLPAGEAGDRIALHIARILRRVIESMPESDRVQEGTEAARRLLRLLSELRSLPELSDEGPAGLSDILAAIVDTLPDGRETPLDPPLTPLLDTTLLTNASGEPRLVSQIHSEIQSADRIDIIMAFVRRSGIRPFRGSLERFCAAGKKIRLLTTSYTGSTEAEALDLLGKIGVDVRVSYDTGSTRLHAKAWHFFRESGFSTAFIGSSNLTQSAQVSGLEWNVRISRARNPDVIEKFSAVFESYWSSGDFAPFDSSVWSERLALLQKAGPLALLSPVEIRLEPFQERLLEQIELSRRLGNHRNLLVSATGTGKTVMAAVDYSRLRSRLARSRLLFVAHREEILQQSLATFRHCLRDHAFGELWVAGHRPVRFDHVFASIQSLAANGMGKLPQDHFDVVVVDEFHHAAAVTYKSLLEHVAPKELLGLTATPERSDGVDVLSWFGGRISAELRLWDAIDQRRLVPFAYYGISDEKLDFRNVPWRRGRGYDVQALTALLTSELSIARHVLKELLEKAEAPERMRVLGFCVSIDHARYMAKVFSEEGVPSVAITSETDDDERRGALTRLSAGSLRVVFSVDVFNEGVDVPRVDTLLLLRPTDSPTLFLQQLGRGLRKADGKAVCTVLDFVGQHRKEFRIDRRYCALLGGGRRELERQIRGGFQYLPTGCHMELDPVASDRIIRQIRSVVPERWPGKVAELKSMYRDGGARVSLGMYLNDSGLELEDVYTGGRSWSELQSDANVVVAEPGPQEDVLRRACGRLLHVDDLVRIAQYRHWLDSDRPPHVPSLSPREARLLRMLSASVLDSPKLEHQGQSLEAGVRLLWGHPQVRRELVELLDVLERRVNHVHDPMPLFGEIPIQLHARYTRREILAAFDVGSGFAIHPWQAGVHWAREAKTDLFAFTLDKSAGTFSPTTRYRDYAISRDLIHWESQSVTRSESETGQRYQGHQKLGSSVVLFARLNTDESSFWCLGPASYVSHTGEQPMSIVWRLAVSLPGDLFAAFAAAVA